MPSRILVQGGNVGKWLAQSLVCGESSVTVASLVTLSENLLVYNSRLQQAFLNSASTVME